LLIVVPACPMGKAMISTLPHDFLRSMTRGVYFRYF
jgi:hypothetical protein